MQFKLCFFLWEQENSHFNLKNWRKKSDYIRQSHRACLPIFCLFSHLASFFILDNCQLTLLERCCWLLVSAVTLCSHGFWLLLSVWLRGLLTLLLTPLKDVSLRSDFNIIANSLLSICWQSWNGVQEVRQLESKVYIRRPHSVNSWWKWCGSRERGGAFCLSAVCWHIIEVPLAL